MKTKYLATSLIKVISYADQALCQLTKQIVTTRLRGELFWKIVLIPNSQTGMCTDKIAIRK